MGLGSRDGVLGLSGFRAQKVLGSGLSGFRALGFWVFGLLGFWGARVLEGNGVS